MSATPPVRAGRIMRPGATLRFDGQAVEAQRAGPARTPSSSAGDPAVLFRLRLPAFDEVEHAQADLQLGVVHVPQDVSAHDMQKRLDPGCERGTCAGQVDYLCATIFTAGTYPFLRTGTPPAASTTPSARRPTFLQRSGSSRLMR
nr:hypothetical protein [uncultured Lichenicoccus sp.]